MQRFSDVTLDQVLALRVAGEDRVAFVERDARLTYHELSHDAGSLAAGLAERGVRRGDRVALLLPAGLDFVRVFWAAQRLGAISCALNPFAPAETIARRVARIRPRLTVTSVDEVPRLGGMASAAPQDPEGIAYLQATSGTSGEPRLAMIRHRNVAAVQRAAIEAMGITANDVLVSWVPPWHDLGLVRFVITPVFTGASCHIVTPSVRTIAEWLATIGRVGGTITGAPDFAYRLAMRLADPRNVDLSTLRFATNGGEPVRQSTIAAFEERFGVRGVVLPGYGLAEATLGVSTIRPGERLRVDERGNVSCGRPMPGVEVRIDVSGEILVRGENVFAGYFDAAEDPRRDGWLHTGDAGRLDEDGHLYVLGRRRAMLKRGGATLAPREVEEAAMHVAGVKIAAAVNVDGEIVVAIESDAVDITSEVARSIHHALGFRPRVIVASIPRTTNGKIRYDALRENLTPVLEAALSTDTVP